MNGALERMLSRVLMVGVVLAALMCVSAMVWHLADGTDGTKPNTAGGIVRALGQGKPMALAQAGILVLVLTPMVRVLVTAVGLWAKGARIVALIAASTLAILAAGIAGVLGGGWGGAG